VTTRRVFSSARVVSGRPVGSVVLLCLVILMIASILVCLPAIHGATELHRNSDALDAFDLGVNVPQTTRGSLAAIILGVLVLAGLWHERMSRGVLRSVDDLTRPERPLSTSIPHPLLGRILRHPGMSGRESDDDASNFATCPMPFMATTPRVRANARSTGGFLFAAHVSRNRDGPGRERARAHAG